MSSFALHHALVTADGAAPARWLIFLHGIYGQGGNWRSVARRLVDRRTDWGCVLADLRMHGRSQGAPAPHTVASAAADLERLAATLTGQGRAVRAVAGHSFGGKVTLAWLGAAGAPLERAWILDASPSARPGALEQPGNSVVAVLDALAALPARLASRDDFGARLAAAGLDPAVVSWLGLNLEPAGDAWRFRLEVPALRALLADYYATDVWPVVEHPPCPLRFVVAGQASALSADDRARLGAIAAANPDVVVHALPDAGHWLNVDAPDALGDLLAADLPS